METEKLNALEACVLSVLSEARYERPISRRALADCVRFQRLMSGKDDRKMRKAIENLRRAGFLICFKPGSPGGYYMAQNMAEYTDYKRREIKSRISSLATTMSEMDKAATVQFGEAVQRSLFEF
ncbi:MAG: hypothetical protein KBA03_03640 [Anaerolineaceae bacterium]|nr:hypothetical protein [Anaerolineaceae bacterium]